jgi:hypothetical protein
MCQCVTSSHAYVCLICATQGAAILLVNLPLLLLLAALACANIAHVAGVCSRVTAEQRRRARTRTRSLSRSAQHRPIEKGENDTEMGENDAKMSENGPKSIENGRKMSENDPKSIENDQKSIDNGPKSSGADCEIEMTRL